MDITKVDSKTTAASSGTTAAKTVEAKVTQAVKKDVVELSNRNPANKKELMAAYSKLRSQQPELQKQAILSAITGKAGTATATEIPGVQNTAATPAAATPAAAPAQKPAAAPTPPPTGNTVKAGRMEATVVNAKGNTGNVIKGPEGFASNNNRATVNGANNIVDLGGNPAAGVRAETFARTGGPAINNANINVTGGNNAVKFNGGMQDNATVNVNGNGNKVNVGNNVDKANLNVAGNNVTVNIADNNPLTKNQSGWNVNVNASDVNITIENGQAKVTGANGNQNFKAEIDQKNHTVTVTQLPQQNANGVTPPSPAEETGA